ncbi:MAG: NAD-dependent aldehyde dehydrogenase [Herbinix sp.]|jgi:aldehyde dehydrogenase (NAD+)|nr:NAD-dependent aldehyde dehydrogenase [Herbinix sp.]
MDEIVALLEKQRTFFQKGKTKELQFRLTQLQKLKRIILKYENEILEALKKDLNKTEFEAYMTEIGMVLDEISFVSKNLKNWVKPEYVKTPLAQFLSSSKIYSEPYGVVLILAPWNYPFQLAIEPLIGAIAAGNCAIIKPSEESSYTSKIIEHIINEAFKTEYISIIQGGREASEVLLEQKFDYIFFTGSVAVGRIVMEKASKHLTPVSLELGGKSPCIVDETANLRLAAKRIIWGKFLNAGQTCVAPDYLFVHREVKMELLLLMKHYIKKFYGADPSNNTKFPKIINQKHFHRLTNLLEGSNILIGGQSNVQSNQIAPTILDKVTWDSPVMQDEIFGPILPVLEFDQIQEVVTQINQHPKPLALYYFTNHKSRERKLLKHTSFGGGCINDTIVHLATAHMPFGGVGDSGMGGYHGKASFDTFSHKKSILKKSNLLDIGLRYPPYQNDLKWLKVWLK